MGSVLGYTDLTFRLGGVVFGKAEKAHPCNAQWVKIYAGLTPYSMNEVFVGNLRNDGLSELKGVRSSAWVWTGNMDRKSGVKSKPRDELVSKLGFGSYQAFANLQSWVRILP